MSIVKPTDEKDSGPRLSRRQRKAEAVRRKALSPIRILLMVLALPLTTGIIAIGVYLRVTDYDRTEAVVHLMALAGCDVVGKVVAGPFREGEAGYHKRNDPDGDGVACGTLPPRAMPGTPRAVPDVPRAVQAPKQRNVGTAKFLKP